MYVFSWQLNYYGIFLSQTPSMNWRLVTPRCDTYKIILSLAPYPGFLIKRKHNLK